MTRAQANGNLARRRIAGNLLDAQLCGSGGATLDGGPAYRCGPCGKAGRNRSSAPPDLGIEAQTLNPARDVITAASLKRELMHQRTFRALLH